MRPFTSGSYRVPKTAGSLSLSSNGRLQTGFAPKTASASYQAVSLPIAELNIHSRSVTGAGGVAKVFADNRDMVGNSTTFHYERQVQDKTYFVGLLRKKINSINSEMVQLRDKKSLLETEFKDSMQKERDIEKLFTEVQNLEGTLGDHNLTLDKLRNDVGVEDLNHHNQRIEKELHKTKLDVDGVFVSKQKLISSIKHMEQAINNIFRESEKLLRQSGEENIIKLNAILQSHETLKNDCNRIDSLCSELLQRKQELLSKETTNKYRNEYEQTQAQIERSIDELNNLEFELEVANMNSSDAHQKVVQRIREIQEQTGVLEEKLTKQKTEINLIEKDIMSLEQDDIIKEMNETDSLSKVQKMRIVDDFLRTYRDSCANFLREKHSLQESITQLLDQISEGIRFSKEELPTIEQFKKLQDEIDFKKKQFEMSKYTLLSVQDQKQKRTEELSKISNLEERIDNELRDLKLRQQVVKEKIGVYDDEEGFLISSREEKERLNERIDILTNKVKSIKSKVTELSSELQLKQRSLKSDPVWTALHHQEEKIQQQEQNIFSLNESIKKKKSRSEYLLEKTACLSLVSQINDKLIDTIV